MLLVACAGEGATDTTGEAEPDTSSSTITPATTTTTTVAAELVLADLVGSWRGDDILLQVGDDGSYSVVDASDPSLAYFHGFVARDGGNVIFVTMVGGECSGETGVYEVALSEGSLHLSPVEDPCAFRAERFDRSLQAVGS